jgi:hypothetical protein
MKLSLFAIIVIVSPLQTKQTFRFVMVLSAPILLSVLLPSTKSKSVNLSPRTLFLAIYFMVILSLVNMSPFSIVFAATTTANVLSIFAGRKIFHGVES